MNAVERVKANYVSSENECSFDIGYLQALDDVQAELDKEVSCCNLEKSSLKDKHRCEIAELEEKNKHKIEELKQQLSEIKRERDEYKNKYEVVELIFGGK